MSLTQKKNKDRSDTTCTYFTGKYEDKFSNVFESDLLVIKRYQNNLRKQLLRKRFLIY